ncbi:unnamed protein product [Camellia sinensis]
MILSLWTWTASRKWTGTYALAEEAVDLLQVEEQRREVLGGPLSEEEVAALVEWFCHNDCSQQINLVSSVMTVWNNVQPDYAANMWNEALNKRLGTKTIPEQDNWIYSDGKSTSCVIFILEMYKEAGLFDPIANSIQVTEFTIKDAYTLKFFENNSSRLPKWCNDADTVKLPLCQIQGKYRMEFPGYNTIDPYPHMNERCPSLPPKYSRPKGC